jgi:predicted nuclease of predicted toxin-antitoxin system
MRSSLLTIATWISSNFPVEAVAVRDLGLRDAEDKEIFHAAKRENVAVMTKDSDFVLLLEKFGPPPQVIWVTCGNSSNARLKEILTSTLPKALELLLHGENQIESTRYNLYVHPTVMSLSLVRA